jgi:hypothetical protein
MNFFIDGAISVTQGTNLYSNNGESNANTSEYDYVFNVAVADSTSVFNVATWIQNQDDENSYNANLTVDSDALLTLFNTATTSVTAGRGTNGTFDNSAQSVGLRFLELAAVKIFGHAKARAAISNDKDFTSSHSGKIMEQIVTGVVSKINPFIANRLFETYVSADLINTDDVTSPQSFNLSGTTWEFPIDFTSSLSGTSLTADLNNGPDDNGVRLADGAMNNVPILLRLSIA